MKLTLVFFYLLVNCIKYFSYFICILLCTCTLCVHASLQYVLHTILADKLLSEGNNFFITPNLLFYFNKLNFHICCQILLLSILYIFYSECFAANFIFSQRYILYTNKIFFLLSCLFVSPFVISGQSISNVSLFILSGCLCGFSSSMTVALMVVKKSQ